MKQKKEIERSASTQSDSLYTHTTKTIFRKRKDSTDDFKNFYVKNLKIKVTPSPNSELSDQASFEELFTMMNQACTFSTKELLIEAKDKSNFTLNLQSLSPGDAIKELTKKLIASRQRYSQLTTALNEKQQDLSQALAQVANLKSTNNNLRLKINDLREQITFWKQGHQKMLQETNNLQIWQNKQNINSNRGNRLKSLKESIKEQRKYEKTKLKIVKEVKGVMSIFSRSTLDTKDTGVQTQYESNYNSSIFQSITLCDSEDNRSLHNIIIQANNQLRMDLKFAEDYISKLKIKVDCLQKKLNQERNTFKIQKEREFAVLKQKFSTFLKDYNRLRLSFHQIEVQNSILKRTLPQEDIFRLSLTPTKLI